MPFDFKDLLEVRPAEIKTYHQNTYDRISPLNTKFDAKGKTLFITAGGISFTSHLVWSSLLTPLQQLVSAIPSPSPSPKPASPVSSSSSAANQFSMKRRKRSRKPTPK